MTIENFVSNGFDLRSSIVFTLSIAAYPMLGTKQDLVSYRFYMSLIQVNIVDPDEMPLNATSN